MPLAKCEPTLNPSGHTPAAQDLTERPDYKMKKVDGYYEYTGCIHIHTTDSDGAGTHEEVAEIANEAGLDFILVTDHMTLKSRHRGKEGFYKKCLLLIGYDPSLMVNSQIARIVPESRTAYLQGDHLPAAASISRDGAYSLPLRPS